MWFQSADAEEEENNESQAEAENAENTWLTHAEVPVSVTSLQPLRNQSQDAADSFFDFDMEPDSPGSPIDECEYSRLIETTTHTPQPTDAAPESGYVCASPASAEGSLASQSSSDGPYFDPESSETERSLATDYHDCIGSYKKEALIASMFENVHNGALKLRPSTGTISKVRSIAVPNGGGLHTVSDGDEVDSGSSDSVPPSQSTTTITSSSSSCSSHVEGNADKSESTVTGPSSHSISTLLDDTEEIIDELVVSESNDNNVMCRKEENRPDNLKIMTENGETREENVVADLKLTNGTLFDVPGEVNCCNVEKQEEDEAIEIKNELIILDCLRVIDATPEASPEPETRHLDVEEECEGKLKVDHSDVEVDPDPDGDGIYDRPQRVRRCSSLKTGKTPPGTPGRKKIVRFADVLGLDLAAVRTFMDEMPKIPKSAYEDLDLPEPGSVNVSLGPRVEKVLMALFQQPGALAGFLDIIRDKHVSLENAAVTDPVTMTISGSVRVRNLDFHKSVYVRYTSDSWRTYSDLQANYVENSCDGFSDKFTFTVFGNALQVGERIELAVRFHCKGQILWDNNFGANYCFQCLPPSAPNRPATAPADVQAETWHGASFY